MVDSPVGSLLVAVSDRGLVRISYDGAFDAGATLEELARDRRARACCVPRARWTLRHRELDEYFEGRRQAFDLAIDLRGLAPFSVAVLGELAKVPYGPTATYGRAGHARRSPDGRPRGRAW